MPESGVFILKGCALGYLLTWATGHHIKDKNRKPVTFRTTVQQWGKRIYQLVKVEKVHTHDAMLLFLF